MGSDHVKGSPNGAKKCFEFGHRNNRGGPCGANVIKGTRGCRRHAGKRPEKARAEGAIVVELRQWGLTSQQDLADPGMTLLRLLTQSVARADLYASLLMEAFDAAGRLQAAESAPQLDDGAAEAARLDLERVMNAGPVAALIGHKYASSPTGPFATGEAIRGLVDLERDERDRCASFAAKAVAAGLAERQVRLAERQGATIAEVILGVLADLGLSVDGSQVRQLVGVHIARATGVPLAIEGTAA